MPAAVCIFRFFAYPLLDRFIHLYIMLLKVYILRSEVWSLLSPPLNVTLKSAAPIFASSTMNYVFDNDLEQIALTPKQIVDIVALQVEQQHMGYSLRRPVNIQCKDSSTDLE